MYTVSTFDIVMAYIGVALLVAFTGTLVHSVMKAKVEAIESRSQADCNKSYSAYTDAQDDIAFAAAELLKAEAWRDAVINLCIVNHISWDETNPEATLAFLLLVEQNMALDPAISRGAAALVNKAKREHGKKIRKAADRKLERTERMYEAELANQHGKYNDGMQSLALARSELAMFQGIVDQELHNFICLPSVRNACKKAINLNHKAWQEL